MANEPNHLAPLIGRGGVQLVAGDAFFGFIALPLSALLRSVLGDAGLPFGMPQDNFHEIDRAALWVVSALSIVLWPLAIRATDPGYPSASLPLRRILIAASIWLLAGSGAI